MSPAARRLVVPVHYDFASSLCYVAHRVLQRLAPDLESLDLELAWTPLDLVQLLGYRRGEPLSESRRRNAERVAEELDVPVAVPAVWRDSRAWNAASLLAAETGCESEWREAAWTALYDDGGEPDVGAVAARVGLALDREALDAASQRVRERTERARQTEVCGAPTFMLGPWPVGGIQSDATMRSILSRWAASQ